MGTGGRWRRRGSCEAWEGLLSSLLWAGLMLKPLDCSGDDEEEKDYNVDDVDDEVDEIL